MSYYSRIYRTLLAGENFGFDPNDRWEKQTLRSRCYIAGPQGRMMLTIPIKKAPSNSPFGGESHPERDMEPTLSAALPQRGSGEGAVGGLGVLLSDHGNWRHQHWNALVSSYKQSPFFDYYADDFAPHYQPGAHQSLQSLNKALHDVVWEHLGLSAVVAGSRPLPHSDEQREYYQVFKARTSFLPDLSIVDLLFNMGPEARLYL